MTGSGTAKARYEQLRIIREPYLDRAERNARLTIPALYPEEGSNGSTILPEPYQSIGAKGVNHLAAKLSLALFPPNQPFFRFRMDQYTQAELEEADAETQQQYDAALGRAERQVHNEFENLGIRSTYIETYKHLIVSGNALLEMLDSGKTIRHPLTHYVVKRDREGNLVEIVLVEYLSYQTLPDEAKMLVIEEDLTEGDENPKDDIPVYTHVRLEDGKWEHYQEVHGKVIPGTEGTYSKDRFPYMALRWTKVDGEDYGRAMIDDQYGDLRTLEGLTKALAKFGAAAAKVIIFVRDTGLTDKWEIVDADSGDVVDGSAEDVTAFQLDKYPDFQVVKSILDDARKRLEEAFLLFSGLRRDAERVTAAEIRAIIQELEQSLGGIYSVLSQDLQLPLVTRLIHLMQKQDKLPKLPDDVVTPQIVTGSEALGRANDAVKLEQLLSVMGATFGPEAVKEVFKPEVAAMAFATALGVEGQHYIRTPEEVEARRAEAMQAQAATQALPQALRNAQSQQE